MLEFDLAGYKWKRADGQVVDLEGGTVTLEYKVYPAEPDVGINSRQVEWSLTGSIVRLEYVDDEGDLHHVYPAEEDLIAFLTNIDQTRGDITLDALEDYDNAE